MQFLKNFYTKLFDSDSSSDEEEHGCGKCDWKKETKILGSQRQTSEGVTVSECVVRQWMQLSANDKVGSKCRCVLWVPTICVESALVPVCPCFVLKNKWGKRDPTIMTIWRLLRPMRVFLTGVQIQSINSCRAVCTKWTMQERRRVFTVPNSLQF